MCVSVWVCVYVWTSVHEAPLRTHTRRWDLFINPLVLKEWLACALVGQALRILESCSPSRSPCSQWCSVLFIDGADVSREGLLAELVFMSVSFFCPFSPSVCRFSWYCFVFDLSVCPPVCLCVCARFLFLSFPGRLSLSRFVCFVFLSFSVCSALSGCPSVFLSFSPCLSVFPRLSDFFVSCLPFSIYHCLLLYLFYSFFSMALSVYQRFHFISSFFLFLFSSFSLSISLSLSLLLSLPKWKRERRKRRGKGKGTEGKEKRKSKRKGKEGKREGEGHCRRGIKGRRWVSQLFSHGVLLVMFGSFTCLIC